MSDLAPPLKDATQGASVEGPLGFVVSNLGSGNMEPMTII